MVEKIVPARHNKSTGLRPTWSERRFQWIAVRASAAWCTDTYDYYLMRRSFSSCERNGRKKGLTMIPV